MEKKRNIWYAFGALVGLAAIVVGIVTLADTHWYSGYTASSASFGADFYTYIYEATEYAADNTSKLVTMMCHFYSMVRVALGWLLVLGGLVDICLFGSKISLPAMKESATVEETFAEEPVAVEEETTPEEEKEEAEKEK